MSIARRRCKKCQEVTDDFRISRSTCRQCERYAAAQYRQKNPEKVKRAQQNWRQQNAEYDRIRKQQWQRDNKEYINQYWRDKRANDISYRIAANLRARLRSALYSAYKTGSAIQNLGCSIDELKVYLADQFSQGMSWDNYGEWHIDHIRPLSQFDLTDLKQLRQAVHYSNLQPLWAFDNQSKGATYECC